MSWENGIAPAVEMSVLQQGRVQRVVTAPPKPNRATALGVAVGRRIRSRREEVGLTQEQLGARLSDPRTKGMVSQWEKGITTPSLEQLREIARELHTDQQWVAYGRSSGTISVAGKIVSGGLVVLDCNSAEYVAVPPTLHENGIDLSAWRVHTDSIPSLHEHDLIFATRKPVRDLRRTVGHDAIVELANGDMIYRRVQRSDKPGCISLTDQLGAAMLDVVPIQVFIVLSIVKASAVATLGGGA